MIGSKEKLQSQNRSDGLVLDSKVIDDGLNCSNFILSVESFDVTFRALGNWCCHYDHYVNVCKNKPPRGNKHVSKYFQLQIIIKIIIKNL